MGRKVDSRVSLAEWALGAFVIVAALVVWWQVRLLPGGSFTIYDFFPLLGIIAFGLMWTHFIFGAIRRYAGAEKPVPYIYGTVSSGAVLAMIILHPGLLWFGLWRDGFGLPPASAVEVYSSQLFALICGTIGLSIFLMYELKRFFGKRRWWKSIEYLQIVGMAVIFYHGLEMGGELNVGWFKVLWWLYAISFISAVGYIHISKWRKKSHG